MHPDVHLYRDRHEAWLPNWAVARALMCSPGRGFDGGSDALAAYFAPATRIVSSEMTLSTPSMQEIAPWLVAMLTSRSVKRRAFSRGMADGNFETCPGVPG